MRKIIGEDMKRLEDKIDKIIQTQIEMNETLIRQEENLKEHMKRTAILEEEVKPIVKHVAMVQGAGVLGAVLATAASIWKGFFS